MRKTVLSGGAKSAIVRIVFSIIFSITIVFSGKITLNGNTYAAFEDVAFRPFSLRDLFFFLLCSFIVFLICSVACRIVSEYRETHLLSVRTHRIRFCLCVFGILVMLWLPCLLTFYPGGIYSDTAASIWMATGEYPLTNHHPILYTMLWRGMFAVGGLFSLSCEGTFFLFTCCTAVCMALTVTYFLYSCCRHGVPEIILILIATFYALYTLVPLYIVSLWKDTPFAIAVLAYSTALMNIFWDKEPETGFFRKRNLIPFLVFGLLTAFLRNNGIYAFVLSTIAVFVFFIRKDRSFVIRTGLLLLSVIAAAFLIRGPLYNKMGWNVDEKVESMGIPLQQVGYILNSTDSLTDRQSKFLNEILPVERWKKTYCPLIVDPVKLDEEFDSGFFSLHAKDFLQVYTELVRKNPAEAVKGYALTTVGFWDPTRQTGTAYVCNFMWNGLKWEMKDIPEENLGISLKPVYSTHIRPSSALYGWLILFFITVGICVQREKRILIPMIPVLGIWLTLLAAVPVAFSLRYFFPAVLVVPMAFVLMVFPGMNEDKR